MGPELDYLQELIDEADSVVIHNSAFDRTVLARHNVRVPVARIADTMVQALAHGLPGSLGQLCDILGVPVDKAKDKRGKKLIQLFTKPRPKNMKLRRADAQTHPEDWAEFVEYARLDVEAMREVHKRLPVWNNTTAERSLWILDQKINDRGVAVDLDLARAALRAAARAGADLADRAKAATGGVVGSLTQRDKLMAYLASEYDYIPENMTKGTVTAALKGDLDPAVRELLEIRQQASATSPAKYTVLVNGTSADGRLRGTLQFCGAARTGRWGGRLFQPQNLPRPTLKQAVIEMGIAAMKADAEDLVVNNVMELCASAVRGCLIAPAGRKLVVADLSNIEGRVLAWLAGEDWKTKAFTDFDRGVGHDLYVLAYSRSFSVTPEQVIDNKKSGDGMMRQLGKIMELACLGPDTQVVTKAGIKAIVDVTENDLLWDGEEWVRHAGLVRKGVRPTVNVAGIEATPDHMFLTTFGWRPAQQLASNPNILRCALATGSANLPSGVSCWDRLGVFGLSGCNAPAALTNTMFTLLTYAKARVRGVMFALKSKAIIGARTFTNTQTRYRTPSTGVACSIGSPLAKPDVTAQPPSNTLHTADAAYIFTKNGAPINAPFLPTSKRWKAGINRIWTWIASTTKKVMNPETYGLLTGKQTTPTDEQYARCKSASQALRPVYDIAYAGPRNRFTVLSAEGPLIVHNCGYQGGVGAFATMARLYGIEKAEDEVLLIVKAWRKAHKAVVSFWYDVEYGVRQVLRDRDETRQVRDLMIDVVDGWLRIRLPSGRYLCYPDACEDEHDKIAYSGVNQYTRKWETLETYGGKLVENIVQATARDVLAHGMALAERAGYEICLHVHDELITETPDDPAYSAEGLSALMAKGPGWSLGLPLAAAGFSCHRYRKD
jgi:hypothetical protein